VWDILLLLEDLIGQDRCFRDIFPGYRPVQERLHLVTMVLREMMEQHRPIGPLRYKEPGR
jgi:hypothetical protein